jgi:ATP-binding cassette, subfamily C, bacterial
VQRTLNDLAGLVTRRHLAASLTALAASSVAEGLGVLMLLPLLHLAGVGSGTEDAVTLALRRAFAIIGAQPTLPSVLGLYIGIAVLQTSLQRAQAVAAVRLEQDIVTALRQRVYHTIGAAEWTFFSRQRVSDGLHVMTAEVERAGTAAYYTIDLAGAAAVALVYFALAFVMSPAVTTGVGVFGLLLAAVLHRHLTRAKAAGHALSAATESLYGALAEHLGGLKTAMSFGAVGRHEESFARRANAVRDVRVCAAGEYGRFRQWMGVGSAAGLAVVVYIALARLAMPTAELLVLLFIFARLMPRVTGLYEKSQLLASLLPAFEAVLGFERRAFVAARTRIEPSRSIDCHRELALDHVTFAYETDRNEPAVRDVSLAVAIGTTTAIVGSSGSGKSTIADLLMALIQPSAGRLLLDGCTVGPECVAAWRRQIGYVPQETFLFHESIRANLLWARPEATEPELWYALQLAAADDFVRALPQGLDTVVGDRGALVSGGERQRLALARALVRQPRVLILDEATSALDSESESRIQKAIERLHRKVTVIIITHRLSTIRHADTIHVLEKGRLIQTGTWDELRALERGRFHELWRAQGLSDLRSVPVSVRRSGFHLEAVNQ